MPISKIFALLPDKTAKILPRYTVLNTRWLSWFKKGENIAEFIGKNPNQGILIIFLNQADIPE